MFYKNSWKLPHSAFRHALEFVNKSHDTFWSLSSKINAITCVISFWIALALREIFFYTLPFKLSHRKKITITKLRSRRPEPFVDYSVPKHLSYSSHGLVHSMCCSAVSLKISILYFCSFHAIEGGIQYIADILISFHLLKK
jgi:hypothetical protein